jgi:NAD(P)H-hydrate epimerase
MANKITRQIVKQLYLPPKTSHKRENGRLLIISGSHLYFGALLYCLKAASRIVDLVYVLTTPENRKLIEKLKSQTAEFMPIDSSIFPSPLREKVSRATSSEARRSRETDEGAKADYNCILIGPGMGKSSATKKLVRQVLKSGKKTVLDADALNVLDDKMKKMLNQKHILTPHRREFKAAFGIPANAKNAEKMMGKYGCTIVLKGHIDIVAAASKGLYLNYTGNEGMTKGGTGDVLAGLIAAFYCKNDAYTSAAAGVFVNGAAGDELYKKVGPFYNAEDLLEQIPKTLWQLTNH